jgi:hypothetical protein
MVNPVHKGKVGEKEFCEFLNVHFDIDLEREYNQASGNDTDIVWDPYFLFEIKRRENLDFYNWWIQVKHAQKDFMRKNKKRYIMPVVAFRQNRKPWEFLLPASLIGIDTQFIHVDKFVFVNFARNYLENFGNEN